MWWPQAEWRGAAAALPILRRRCAACCLFLDGHFLNEEDRAAAAVATTAADGPQPPPSTVLVKWRNPLSRSVFYLVLAIFAFIWLTAGRMWRRPKGETVPSIAVRAWLLSVLLGGGAGRGNENVPAVWRTEIDGLGLSGRMKLVSTC